MDAEIEKHEAKDSFGVIVSWEEISEVLDSCFRLPSWDRGKAEDSNNFAHISFLSGSGKSGLQK